MFVGRVPGRVSEIRVGADRSKRGATNRYPYPRSVRWTPSHRHGGAPEIEVGVVRVVGPVVRGIRLHRRQGEGAGKTEARDNGRRARAPRAGEAREARRPAGGGYSVWRGMAAPAGRQPVRRRWRAALLPRSHGLGARRSALGARRSALGARRSALGARRRSALGARRSALGARRSALGARTDSFQPLRTIQSHCHAAPSPHPVASAASMAHRWRERIISISYVIANTDVSIARTSQFI